MRSREGCFRGLSRFREPDRGANRQQPRPNAPAIHHRVEFAGSYTVVMLAMLLDLFEHQAYADAAMVNAIRQHDIAARDEVLRVLLHHILIAHRFWIHLGQGLPFSIEDERETPDSLDPLVSQYRDTQKQEREWLVQLKESDLSRTLESTFFPGRLIPLSEALMQVCLHSHGHRSQCATRLRQMGGEPPPLDFIVWVQDRPAPVWDELHLRPT
jgi:uncharacterized damage-inducible protein DinB